MEQFEQCLMCKAVKNDPNSIYTSDGEMICQECQEWWMSRRKDLEEKDNVCEI